MECLTKKETILTYLDKRDAYDYQLMNGLRLRLIIEHNPYQIPLDNLFSLATRQNPKRSFLFVSRLLGKHIPIDPCTYQVAGRALALRFLEDIYSIKEQDRIDEVVNLLLGRDACGKVHNRLCSDPILLPEPVVFIGFAETATALGYGMFDSFYGDSDYLHSTRDIIPEIEEKIFFREEHSHASSHYIYHERDEILSNQRTLVLVDDELTTGKTALNIIEALQNKFPRKKYVIATILDWRSDEDRLRFDQKAQELGVTIQVVSLVQGEYELLWSGSPKELNSKIEIDSKRENPTINPIVNYYRLDEYFQEKLKYTSLNEGGEVNTSPYLFETGRFGIGNQNRNTLHEKLKNIGEALGKTRRGNQTLCLGMGEFIYIPMVISAWMGTGIKFHSTTRSPIYPCNEETYGIKNAFQFQSPEDPSINNYLYNIPINYYDEVYLIMERQIDSNHLAALLDVLKGLGIPRINIVTCIGQNEKPSLGSYSPEDVVFLLKDIGNEVKEQGTRAREKAIQSGIHYSEMLPVEYEPSKEYIDLFHQSLKDTDKKLAIATGIVAEKILKNRGKDIVLVSLARAGTPVGILIKRYIKLRYGLDLPHYSISIIREKGLDRNGIQYILKYHPGKSIQFIDGWTGKGVISRVLLGSCEELNKLLQIDLNPDLAVLADPGQCTSVFGSREDFLIPSACLNATVSGLISRTVHRKDLIGRDDFHGVKYYTELASADMSNLFVDTVSSRFPEIIDQIAPLMAQENELELLPTWSGLQDIKRIQQDFGIENINLIKPGIGETTRVLLRRMPWKILVKDPCNDNLKHIMVLAKEKGIPVEIYHNMTYQCCGLIQPLGSDY